MEALGFIVLFVLAVAVIFTLLFAVLYFRYGVLRAFTYTIVMAPSFTILLEGFLTVGGNWYELNRHIYGLHLTDSELKTLRYWDFPAFLDPFGYRYTDQVGGERCAMLFDGRWSEGCSAG